MTQEERIADIKRRSIQITEDFNYIEWPFEDTAEPWLIYANKDIPGYENGSIVYRMRSNGEEDYYEEFKYLKNATIRKLRQLKLDRVNGK